MVLDVVKQNWQFWTLFMFIWILVNNSVQVHLGFKKVRFYDDADFSDKDTCLNLMSICRSASDCEEEPDSESDRR